MATPDPRTARQQALRRALAQAGAVPPTAAAQAEVVRALWRQITQKLEPVIGGRGVEALWTRALHLIAASYPWLGPALAVPAGEEPHPAAQSAELMNEAGEALLMTFFDILAGMIGEPLTGRLLNQVWARDPAESSRETAP